MKGLKINNEVGFFGIANTLLAFLFFIQLVISVRPASDDLQFIITQNDLGFFEIIKYHYFFLTGRLSNYFLFGILAKADLFSRFTIIAYYSLVFAALVSGFYLVLNRNLSLGKNYTFFLSVLFFEILYFITPASSESWFWLCASVSYLMPCAAFVLAFALQHSKMKFVSIATCILFFYAGNSSENLSLTLLVIYFVYIRFYVYRSNNWKAFFLNYNLIAMLSGLFVNIFSIGNIRRFGLETELRDVHKGNFFDPVLSYVFQYDIYIAVALICLILFAFNEQISSALVNIRTKWIVLLIVVLVFTSLTPLYFIFNSNYPARTLTPLLFPIILALFLFAKESSKYIKQETNTYLICAYSISIIAVTSLSLKNMEGLRNYRNSYDQRWTTINENKKLGTTETLYLTKLPDPGRVTGTIEIDTDTTNGNNKQWKKLLDLPFSIALKKEE